MRNKIFLFLIFATITASGQNHLLGVKGGVSWTNVAATNFSDNLNSRTGLAIGLTYDYLFTKYFSVGADIIYNQRGFTDDVIYTDDFGNPTGEQDLIKFNYDYLTLPVNVRFNFGKTIYGFFDLGLTPSILVDAKTITPSFDYFGMTFPGETISVTNKVNKFDIGALVEIGGGYKFNQRYWLFSSISYQQSFTTITNSDYFPKSTIKHFGTTISLGIKCALTKE